LLGQTKLKTFKNNLKNSSENPIDVDLIGFYWQHNIKDVYYRYL